MGCNDFPHAAHQKNKKILACNQEDQFILQTLLWYGDDLSAVSDQLMGVLRSHCTVTEATC